MLGLVIRNRHRAPGHYRNVLRFTMLALATLIWGCGASGDLAPPDCMESRDHGCPDTDTDTSDSEGGPELPPCQCYERRGLLSDCAFLFECITGCEDDGSCRDSCFTSSRPMGGWSFKTDPDQTADLCQDWGFEACSYGAALCYAEAPATDPDRCIDAESTACDGSNIDVPREDEPPPKEPTPPCAPADWACVSDDVARSCNWDTGDIIETDCRDLCEDSSTGIVKCDTVDGLYGPIPGCDCHASP